MIDRQQVMYFPTNPQYAQGILEAERLIATGSEERALSLCISFLPQAESAFTRAYLLGLIGSIADRLCLFPQALQAYQDALAEAERVPWPDFIAKFSFQIGEIHLHLGEAHLAKPAFQRASEGFRQQGNEVGEFESRQGLANAALDQGQYSLAQELALQLQKKLTSTSSFSSVLAVKLLEVRTSLYLGENRRAHQAIDELKRDILQNQEGPLAPYLFLLQGKLALVEGRYEDSLTQLRKAAEIFTALGDAAGQVESRLAMTAPMLEFQWIHEAQRVLHPLAVWNKIGEYPALQHSIHLRRLALSAFLGVWVKQDLDLLEKNPFEKGSVEDWIQFWFHLSLAANRLNQSTLAQEFLQKSRRIIEEILKGLNARQRKNYLNRPDIARLYRLMDTGLRQQQVVGNLQSTDSAPAEAATLAPPSLGGKEDF